MIQGQRDGNRSGRRRGAIFLLATLAAIVVAVVATAVDGSTGYTVVGWNNLGMHCMDADFGVFAILPPYNTIQAQVVDSSGNLVTSGSGITVTYQAVADPAGSINTSSQGKTNFWQYVQNLFGVSLPVDSGLVGKDMPGPANSPQPMTFDPKFDWFIAEGIPITPYDDGGKKNYYPMMRVTAEDSSGNVLATTDIVLPVSDEMDCSACHASGSGPAAQPAQGWVYDPDPQRDYRLNVLRLHDDKQGGNATYQAALAARGYNSGGLYPTVVTDGKSVLCATCHLSEALAGSGYTGIPPLTQSIHTLHSTVVDPTNGLTLDSTSNRSACYRCHPGSTTRCLRGVMGNSVASDGTMAIQCQNCHGPMSAVGASTRTGWLQEPACQECHTGTAVHNNGQIRYTSVFDSSGQPRVAVDATFATNANTPASGLDLYRFSAGHGGVQCAACHGSTHAEFPSSHVNDNVQSMELQGHVGTIAECSSCHPNGVSTVSGGPHGMHPVGQAWVSSHDNAAEGGAAACQACHGSDYRGTVLSRSFADRTITTSYGTKQFWRGFQVGCYTCHNGPSSDGANPNHAPVVQDVNAATSGTPVSIPLKASDADGNSLTLRVVGQPQNGTAGLSGTTATYFPFAGFSGTDTFTYAAWDGMTDSNLGHVTVSVAGGGGCTLTCSASVPSSATAGSPVSFSGSATPSGCSGTPSYDWSFGDGTADGTSQNASHTYASAGTYTWVLTTSLSGVTCAQTGTIVVGSVSTCTLTCSASAPASVQAGVTVDFLGTATTSGCSGTPSYQWNFGDGGSSGDQNPSHTYTSAGTYSWTLTVSLNGQTCVSTGSIAVTSENPAPTISQVTALSNPFRIKITGTNFSSSAKVYIGADTSPWSNTTVQSSQTIVLKGNGLKNRFPKGVTVTLKVVNPDGQYAVGSFARSSVRQN